MSSLVGGPFLHDATHLLVTGEFTALGLRQSLTDLLGLPLAHIHILANGLGGNIGTAAVLRLAKRFSGSLSSGSNRRSGVKHQAALFRTQEAQLRLDMSAPTPAAA